MVLVLLIGLVFAGVAVALFARSLLLPRVYAVRTLRQIGSYRLGEVEHEPAEFGGAVQSAHGLGARSLAFRPAIDSLANRLGARSSGEEKVRRLLLAAGLYTVSPRRFSGYQTLAALAGGAFWLLFMLAGDPSPALAFASFVITVFGGWSLPRSIVRRRARRRASGIDREMPDLLDMLVTSIEAGLGFAASLQVASRRFRDSALGEELRLTLREQSMGLSLRDALGNMAERQDTVTIRSFVRSIVQSEQLGVSIGKTLRDLASEVRARHKQQVEEQARKAPVKLVFPLVLFIFPSLLVIILGPAVLRLREVF